MSVAKKLPILSLDDKKLKFLLFAFIFRFFAAENKTRRFIAMVHKLTFNSFPRCLFFAGQFFPYSRGAFTAFFAAFRRKAEESANNL